MPLGDKIRELDEQVATTVRRAVEDLREEIRRRLDEATADLQLRLGEVAPELPEHFVSEEHLRRIAEEAAAPASEALDQAREEGREEGRHEGRNEGRGDAHEGLRAALSEIDRARSQAAVLEALLGATAGYAPRAAVLLAREGRLAGWGARGFEADTQAVRAVALDAGEEPWGGLVAGSGPETITGARCAPLVSQLESSLPRDACALPLVLRDRVAAVLYADRPEEEGRIDLPALQVLTYAAALALETLAFREREATATLAPVAGAAAAAVPAEEESAWEEEPAWAEEEPAWEEEPAEPAAEVEAEAEELPAPAGEEYEIEAEGTEPPVLLEEEVLDLPEAPEVEAGPEVEAEEYELPEPEPEGESPYAPLHGDALLQPVEEERPPGAATEELDAGALEETAFEEAPALEEPIPWETEPAGAAEHEEDEEEPAAAPVWAEPEADEEEDEEGEPAELEGRPEAGDVPPPPPQPPTSSGPVAPPADVEGPGWAFSATREAVSKDQEASHEEARRLARLLVSEIQLYNQEAVEEGRRNRDVYDRLKDDIDRSRQLYEERVDPEVRERTDYFYQELVRQLGAGDAKALGI
jgi:hypothetical protein